jgi:ADP-ribose pyrophosphatase YjhB (NUDIX family)
MLFFINDIPLKVTKNLKKVESRKFDFTNVNQHFFFEDTVKGTVLLKYPALKQVLSLVKYLQKTKNHKIKEVVILSEDKKIYTEPIKATFRKIEAGGGLIMKDGKFLMIHRLGLWDLPKGKLDEGETIEECALREVEEECCVKATMVEKITDTWHSYTTRGGNEMLKKTSWYLMACINDSKMKPQTEESIDDIRWMTAEQVQESLKTSYKSIEYVFEKYQKLKETK